MFSCCFISSSTAFEKGQFIPGGGKYVIGEEQDEHGGGFTPQESFYGDMSQLNIWDRQLSADEIYDLALSCKHDVGNVVAWSDFASNLFGNVIKTTPSVACDCMYSLF